MGFGIWRLQNAFSRFFAANGTIGSFVMRNVNNLSCLYSAPFIYIYANRTNIGDYISFLGIQQLFHAKGLELHAAKYGLWETRHWLNAVKKRRTPPVLLIGGGGLFQDVFESFWALVVSAGLKYVVFGVGVCSLEKVRDGTKMPLLSEIAQGALHIHVRDKRTQTLMLEAGAKNVTVGICPSVNYLAQSLESDNKIYDCSRHPSVLLNSMHEFDLAQCGVDVEKFRIKTRTICDKLCLSYEETNNVHSNHNLILDKYKMADIVLSSRLHGCIIAAAYGKAVVPICCDRKIESYIDTHHDGAIRLSPQDVMDKNVLINVIRNAISFPHMFRMNGNIHQQLLESKEVVRDFTDSI